MQNRAVHGRDCSASLLIFSHLNEGKATGLTRIPILHDCDTFDRAMGLEERSQLVFGCVEVKIPNENVHHGLMSLQGAFVCPITRRRRKETIRMRIASCKKEI
jgi:hypothetical protein